MSLTRDQVIGPPHTYLVRNSFAFGQPLFAEKHVRDDFLLQVDRVRQAFDAFVFGYVIDPSGYQLVLRHRSLLVESDAALRARWAVLGGSPATATTALRRRMTSLSGCMQTLAQGFSRRFNRRHGTRGRIWQARYHCCLLADDTALLCALSWMDRRAGRGHNSLESSAGRHGSDEAPILSGLPLAESPDGSVMPADSAPPTLGPPERRRNQVLLTRWHAALDDDTLDLYGRALQRAIAFGLPESLTDALARLGREAGRGRSRRLRFLDDQQGLCGIWG